MPDARRSMLVPERAWARDAIGLAWVVLAGAVAAAPLLRTGISLGPFDQLARAGLTHTSGAHVHYQQSEDLILQFVPWSTLAWHQVHAGHLPLWNPYNVLGTPLAFNWQSAVFSPPNLVSYLVPLRYAYTAIVLVKMLIAGTGAYFCARVLRLGVLAATFAAVCFELSGPIFDRYGWAMTGVTVWLGWFVALSWLVLEGRRPRRAGALLALTVAMMVYGGHPESLAVVGLAFVVFLVVALGTTGPDRLRRERRAVGQLVWAAVGGAMISAPLWLPGAQLAALSARRGGSGEGSFPLSRVTNLLVGGLQGQNVGVAAYLGTAALALALVGFWIRRRQQSVKALGAMALLAALLTFTPLNDLLDVVPGGRLVTWNRSVMVLAFCLAVLAAVGVQVLVEGEELERALRLALVALVTGAVVLLGLALIHGRPASYVGQHLGGLGAAGIGTLVGLVVVVLMRSRARRGIDARARTVAGAALVAGETVFLVLSGVSFWPTSSQFFPSTPAVRALQQAAGTATVGFGECSPIGFDIPATVDLGISADANIGYGVHEFSVYDVTVPRAYARSWHAASGSALSSINFSLLGIFCPAVTTVSEARLYGVNYVLEPAGAPGPAGTRFVRRIGGEGLFRVPGSAAATAVSLPSGASAGSVPDAAPGTPLAVTHPDPASWRIAVDARHAELVRVRLTAVPGWRATVDGHGQALGRWSQGAMLEVRVPPGRSVVELYYWPRAFTAGIVAALAGLAALVFVLLSEAPSRRRRPAAAPPAAPTGGVDRYL